MKGEFIVHTDKKWCAVLAGLTVLGSTAVAWAAPTEVTATPDQAVEAALEAMEQTKTQPAPKPDTTAKPEAAAKSQAYMGLTSVQYGKNRTGRDSYTDVKSFSMMAAGVRRLELSNGALLNAIVFEGGDYAADNVGKNGLRSHLKSSYAGAGWFSRRLLKNGSYYQGFVDGGQIYRRYKWDNMNVMDPHDDEFMYLGLHLGLGKNTKLTKHTNLDVYGKYFYTYHAGHDYMMRGHHIEVENVSSNRFVIGARWKHRLGRTASYYAGAAVNRACAAAQKTRRDGVEQLTSAKYETYGMFELGTSLSNSRGLTVDLTVREYAGTKRGTEGQARFIWAF